MPGYEDFGQNDQWEPDEKGYRFVEHREAHPEPVVVIPKTLSVSNRLTVTMLILFVLAAAALLFQVQNRMFLQDEKTLIKRSHNQSVLLLCEYMTARSIPDHTGLCKAAQP